MKETGKTGPVGEVPMVQVQPHPIFMEILVEVINAPGVETGGPPDKTVNLIPLLQQELGKIGSILTSDSCNQRAFHEFNGLPKNPEGS